MFLLIARLLAPRDLVIGFGRLVWGWRVCNFRCLFKLNINSKKSKVYLLKWMEKVWNLICVLFSRDSATQGDGGGVICSSWEHHTKHMGIYFSIVPHPHHYGVKIWGTAGGWLVRSGSQTLLLSNCPCFIYILTFGVIFPCLHVMHLNLVGEGTHPEILTLIPREQGLRCPKGV